METIYREVAVSERLPKEGWVLTPSGGWLFVDKKFKCTHSGQIQDTITHWLEEIDLTQLQKDKEELLHFMKYFMQSLEDEDFIMTNNTDEDVVDNLLSTFNSLIQKHKA